MSRGVAAALMMLFAASASGDEGVREINQASASGVPGALHVISAPGSYRLTGDLLAPAGSSGIRIDVSDVTLDLNGFTIAYAGGLVLATHGITGSGLSNIEIRGGTIRGFPTSGVHLPSGQLHRVIDVRVLGNGTFGINLQGTMAEFGGHIVRGCTASGNASGMRVEPAGSLVVDSVARNNTGSGLVLGPGVGYARNAVSGSPNDVSGGTAVGCNLIGATAVCPP